MTDTLVAAVVHVGKERFPGFGKRGCVDGKAMVLAGDKTPLGPFKADGLVVAPVAVLELIDGGSGGFLQGAGFPMQIPISGRRSSGFEINFRMFSTVAEQVSGLPGPLDRKSPSNSRLLKS